MALRDLSDPQAVIDALDEFDRIGRAAFLKKYRFGRAQRYLLRRGSRLYDSKAIAAAAHGYQFERPLRNQELYGGLSSAVPKLRELGFEIVDTVPQVDSGAAFDPGELVEGDIYSWDDLAELFGFQPGWLNRMGGMGSLPTDPRDSAPLRGHTRRRRGRLPARARDPAHEGPDDARGGARPVAEDGSHAHYSPRVR